MLPVLALVVWSLLVGAVGSAVSYHIGHRHSWQDSGPTGIKTLLNDGWLSREGGDQGGE